jgi:hypothetical protein
MRQRCTTLPSSRTTRVPVRSSASQATVTWGRRDRLLLLSRRHRVPLGRTARASRPSIAAAATMAVPAAISPTLWPRRRPVAAALDVAPPLPPSDGILVAVVATAGAGLPPPGGDGMTAAGEAAGALLAGEAPGAGAGTTADPVGRDGLTVAAVEGQGPKQPDPQTHVSYATIDRSHLPPKQASWQESIWPQMIAVRSGHGVSTLIASTYTL